MSTKRRTAVRGAWTVAFLDGRHQVIRRGLVGWTGDRIDYVGTDVPAETDEVIELPESIVMPGLINLHSHAGAECGGRLILDHGRPDFFNTGYMNVQTAKPGHNHIGRSEDPTLGSLVYLCECVKHGATTVVSVGQAPMELVDAANRLGVRVYAGPRYASGVYVDPGQGPVKVEWDEGRARAGLEAAREFCRLVDGDGRGLVKGMLCPHAVDTCSSDLLDRTQDAASALGACVQIHAAQGILEFVDVVRRTGQTPIRWLAAGGWLRPNLILGHAVFLDHHPLASAQGRLDLDLIAQRGSHVAHCPVVFARRGWALHSFDRYRSSGITVGLGTDTCPRDMVDEMRWASYVCKLVEGDWTAGQPADVFEAATVGGATALGRSDLGRLEPGAKADIVSFRLDTLRVSPVFDPVRSLIHYSAGSPAENVWVDGDRVVDSGRIVGVDEQLLSAEVQRMAERLWTEVPRWEGRGRTAEEMCPPAFERALQL